MKFFKAAVLAMLLALFGTGCVYDGAYASDSYVYGTIYDNRYGAHYDPSQNYRHHGRGYRNYYHRGNHISIDVFTQGPNIRIDHHNHDRRRNQYQHCRIVWREDWDRHHRRHVMRRYRVCN